MYFLFVISLFKSYMSKQYYSKLKKKVYVVWAAKVFEIRIRNKIMKMCKLKVYFVFFCCKIFRYVTLLHIAVQRGKLTNKFNNLTTTCQWRISYTSINISLLTFTTLYEKHAKHFDLACLSVHKSLSVLINLYLCCRFTLPSLQGDFQVYNNLEFSIKGDQDVAVWNYLSMNFFCFL